MTEHRREGQIPAERDSAALLRQLIRTGTVADLATAIRHDEVAKSDLQLYGIDWSQLESETPETRLGEAFDRHGAVPPPTNAP